MLLAFKRRRDRLLLSKSILQAVKSLPHCVLVEGGGVQAMILHRKMWLLQEYL